MNNFLPIAFVLANALFAADSLAQNVKDIILDSSHNGKMLSQYLMEVEQSYGVDFIVDMNKMHAYTINGITERKRLTDFLNDYMVEYKVLKYSDQVIFIVDRRLAESYGLKRENIILFAGETSRAAAISGSVRDALTGDILIGAKVQLPGTKRTTVTDVNGEFNMTEVQGEVIEVAVEYVGYEPSYYVIGRTSRGSDATLQARLLPESTELQSVTITADREDENVTAKISGVENLSITTLKILPAFLGEVDPIRSLTTLPGVSTAGELASGFNVRGGESGQNLVLQDGAIIYNPSHLFGFFSAFNPDMVSNVTLYKGGGPANFGGRISSVLDVSLRNGDAGKHTISGGLGLVSSRLTAEGPIVRNRSSYLLGGRISYVNWLVKATDNISLKNSKANFRDLTGKIFHTINENNYLTLTGYHSYDDFRLATDSVFSWGTTNFSLKWDHSFNENSYSSLVIFNSNYSSEVHSINEIEGFRYLNSIRNLGLKYDFTRSFDNESKIIAGVSSTGTALEPGNLVPDENAHNILPQDMEDQRSLENAIYVQWEPAISNKWTLSAGIRYSHFLRVGDENVYMYDYNNMDGRYPSIGDTVRYSTGETISSYSGLEPRVSLGFIMDNTTSIKASYFRGLQYLHLVSNTTSTTPQDYWISSGPYLQPQIGDQYTLGLFKNLKENRYELSLEGFYKDISNAVDYIEGADITLNPALEAGLSQGHGMAYGVETLLKKSAGRLNGWVSYTYSRSLRQFEDQERNLVINNGEYYPSAFDQPHNLTVILNYHLGGRLFLSSNFNYSTGRPITIPVSKFSYDAYLSVLNYSERNAYRIPDYHRLDLSLTIKDKPGRKRFHSEWVISLFNVYGRKNTYSISFNRYGTASKLSVIGTIFPSVNYNFRF